MRKIVILMVCLLNLILLVNIVLADPQLNSITTEPENPEPLAEVTVIANITGDDILEVRGIVSECIDKEGSGSACFNNINFDMSLNSNGLYESTIILEDDEDRSDHIEWIFYVNDSGVEYGLEGGKTYLDLGNNNQNNNENPDQNNNSEEKTPGFELILILGAIFIGIIYYKRKR